MASAVSFLFHIPDVNIKAMKGEKIMLSLVVNV